MFDPTLVTGIGAILAVVFITGRAPTRSKGGDVDLESGTRVVVGGRAIEAEELS